MARAGARLAARARVRRPVHERLAPDRRAAPAARLALPPVDGQRPVEVAALAVHVDVQRVEARAALAQRLPHHVGHVAQQRARPRAGTGRARALAVQPWPATATRRRRCCRRPEIRVWSSSARLTPVRRAAAPRRRPPGRRPGRTGRGRCARSRPAARRRPATAASPPNVRWSTKRSCGPPSVNVNRTRRCGPGGAAASSSSIWPGHAEVADDRVAGVQREPQVLAAPADVGDRSGRPARRRSRPRRRRAGAPPAGAAPRPSAMRAAGDPAGEPLPDGLDLGQLRHQPAGVCRRGRRRGRSVASAAGAVSARNAASAARCSASFLVRPWTPPCRSRRRRPRR